MSASSSSACSRAAPPLTGLPTTIGNELALLTRCVTRPMPLPIPNRPLIAPAPFKPPLPAAAEDVVEGVAPFVFRRPNPKIGLFSVLVVRGGPLPDAVEAASSAGKSLSWRPPSPPFSFSFSFAGVRAGVPKGVDDAAAAAAAAAARSLVVLVPTIGGGGGSISFVCFSFF